eukprot:CAMPEP_0176425008 /NCGR_PEP_ID=MMETSP0127-20121128/11159_1 /TAXON_ID=938130 /ORGANISM="Platyophrya macrostoma, Strain WH" /LENGTH=997 /DNA_ID=CAMNT_0017806139 /DNA_START=114 /DNA_END=3107 /DNA_ORIENTATION=-
MTSQSATRHATDAKTIRAPHQFEQFAAMTNLEYLEDLVAKFKEDKSSVDASWHPLLENITSASPDEALIEVFTRPEDQDFRSTVITEKERVDNMRLAWMVRAYEKAGHSIAALDPLGMYHADLNPVVPADLEPSRFGFTHEDMERSYFAKFGGVYGSSFQSMVTGSAHRPMKLSAIIAKLKQLHTNAIGFEFMSSGHLELRQWFRKEIVAAAEPLHPADRKAIYDDIVKACGFEAFLHRKYATHKRFGLDGAESLIPAMNAVIEESAKGGVEAVTLGMPHRGRLNVLVNVCGKSVVNIFNEFEGKTHTTEVAGTGDVKYHLGIEKQITTPSGKKVFVNLLANPSHLEAVNPLVVGKTCARQLYTKDTTMDKNLPIVLHGDAAFAGQGICYEVMGLCDLENFHVGGTIHIVVNNQVGFTTDPQQSRSSPYCTDLSRVCNAPVLHVNGDNVDAVVKCARIAARFRKEYKRDIIIDLVCYRRYGHNETDVPQFTQPIMYQAIAKQPVVVDKVAAQLVADGIMSKEEATLKKKEYDSLLRQEFENAQNAADFVKVRTPYEEANSTRYSNAVELSSLRETGLPLASLQEIGKKLTTIPADFKPHPIVNRTIESRAKAISTGEGVEWCLAEALAFGASSLEGVHVRLTGQDVERGTFTQRHAVWTDHKTNAKYTALSNLASVQAPVIISNSSLSEYGVCGFEAGYAMENPKSLVMWEAQFGDFSNGAQIIFDQFLASGESKWIRQCGLAISLPHGFSGQGPEHSSARVERFLQLSDDLDTVPAGFSTANAAAMNEARISKSNWQVCYPSTPANYYHMLRRQTHRDFRKPLVFFFSKARLRAPNVSSLHEMAVGTSFQPVIDTAKPNQVARKVVFCCGQIENICNEFRKKEQTGDYEVSKYDDVVLVKLEQIAPFPWEHVGAIINKYAERNPQVEFVWLQEEPKNMGPFEFVRPRLQGLLRTMGIYSDSQRVKCIARPTAASPATGYTSIHKAEEEKIISEVFA